MSEPILRVRGLVKAYQMGRRELRVLDGVDLDLMPGEILAIVGQSGSGKSTLLHHIGLLDVPDSGDVILNGERLPIEGAEAAWIRNRDFGFVFQFYHLLPEFNALENVLMPAMIGLSRGEWRRDRQALKERAVATLGRMGLSERLRHRPKELSGGERQRIAIARALMNDPAILLCDEPTGNLDRETADEMQELLWGLNRDQGQTIIVVTHDSNLAARADRTLILVDGRLKSPEEAREGETA